MLIKENHKLYFTNEKIEHLETIPSGVWLLNKEDWRGFSLIEQPDFQVPEKVYGDSSKMVERYLNTFNARNNSMGILLSGAKGSGKSTLARMTSIASGLPALLVTSYYAGGEFSSFLSTITQPIVVFIDEFEKIYDTEEKQNDMLSILDGIFNTKKLFILTSNTAALNPFLINRPGRIYYHKHFETLPEEVVLEIVEDKLEDQENAKELVEITKALGQISADSLIAIISEMNLYKETARQAIKHMNVNVEHGKYQVKLHIKGKRYNAAFDGHPLSNAEYMLEYSDKEDASWWGWSNKAYKVILSKMEIEYGEDGLIKLRDLEDNTLIIFEKIKTYNFEI